MNIKYLSIITTVIMMCFCGFSVDAAQPEKKSASTYLPMTDLKQKEQIGRTIEDLKLPNPSSANFLTRLFQGFYMANGGETSNPIALLIDLETYREDLLSQLKTLPKAGEKERLVLDSIAQMISYIIITGYPEELSGSTYFNEQFGIVLRSLMRTGFLEMAFVVSEKAQVDRGLNFIEKIYTLYDPFLMKIYSPKEVGDKAELIKLRKHRFVCFLISYLAAQTIYPALMHINIIHQFFESQIKNYTFEDSILLGRTVDQVMSTVLRNFQNPLLKDIYGRTLVEERQKIEKFLSAGKKA